jgi:hypothetical protein
MMSENVWRDRLERCRAERARDRVRIRELEEALALVREAHRPYREDLVRHALEAVDGVLPRP